MNSGIYKITNIITGKVYVGSSVNIKKRFVSHKWLLKKNIHHSVKLQYSYNKHGKDKFLFEVVEICSPDNITLFEKEQYYIDLFDSNKNGYNMGPANINRLSYNPSDDTKEKIGDANRGEKNGMYGKTPWNKGKKDVYSKETLNKMSGNNKGKTAWNKGCKGCQPQSNEIRNKRVAALVKVVAKKIKQFTIEGVFIREWDSARMCERELGISSNSISSVCNGKRKTAGGFKFEHS